MKRRLHSLLQCFFLLRRIEVEVDVSIKYRNKEKKQPNQYTMTMLHANTMMVAVTMVLLSVTAEGANMIRQRTTRRVVEASPIVAAAVAHTHHESPQDAREFGVVDTVEQEAETEELEQYVRHLMSSSMSMSMPDAPTPSPSK